VLTSAAVQEDGGVIGLAVIAMKHAEAGRTLHAGMNIVAILREPVYAQSTEPTDA
jgi:hypothetical protein